jgi:hypothetical protein
MTVLAASHSADRRVHSHPLLMPVTPRLSQSVRSGSTLPNRPGALTHYSGCILPRTPFVLTITFARILLVMTLVSDERFGLVDMG